MKLKFSIILAALMTAFSAYSQRPCYVNVLKTADKFNSVGFDVAYGYLAFSGYFGTNGKVEGYDGQQFKRETAILCLGPQFSSRITDNIYVLACPYITMSNVKCDNGSYSAKETMGFSLSGGVAVKHVCFKVGMYNIGRSNDVGISAGFNFWK